MKKSLRIYVQTLMLSLAVVVLLFGLAQVDSAGNEISGYKSESAVAFSRTHSGVSVKIFDNRFELNLGPAGDFFGYIGGFFVKIYDFFKALIDFLGILKFAE